MPSIKQIIAELLIFMQGWSLAFGSTVGRVYEERGGVYKVMKKLIIEVPEYK